MAAYNDLYNQWQIDKSPETLGGILKSLDPAIVQEVQNYQGPKKVLHVRAKQLALGAIKTYDPSKGANLRTWVTAQLQPLSRYGQSLAPVKTPELAGRKAAEIHRTYENMHDRLGRYPTDDELSDEIGISKAKLEKLRKMRGFSTSESAYALSSGDENDEIAMPSASSHDATSYATDAVYSSLDPREKVIMDWKTGAHGKEELSNAEIAARLGVSPAFVSQVSASIANRVRKVVENGV
jgi:RNA polymerase primary sigma factor